MPSIVIEMNKNNPVGIITTKPMPYPSLSSPGNKYRWSGKTMYSKLYIKVNGND
jgi:hypothetical protein